MRKIPTGARAPALLALAVTVALGDKSRQKLLAIDGLTLDEVRRKLAESVD